MEPLLRISEDEFVAELSSAIHQDDWFAEFIEADCVERTRGALVGIKQSIIAQLQKYKEQDIEWRNRATKKMRWVDFRLAQIKGLRKSAAVGETRLRDEWSSFAFAIASALEVSNMNPMLDQIYLNSMSARDFLEGRRRMQQGGALNALIVSDED